MTTREKIEEKVRKHNKMNKLTKLIGFIGMSIVFGILILFWQGISYDSISQRADDYVWNLDTTKSVAIQKIDIASENSSQWIYAKYTYLDSVSPILGGVVFIGSSLLFSMILIFVFFVPMFGVNDRWYYDEFTITASFENKSITGKKSDVVIKGLRINKLEDLGDNYKINATTYDLTNIPGNDDFEVEKWKITGNVKKWIWF